MQNAHLHTLINQKLFYRTHMSVNNCTILISVLCIFTVTTTVISQPSTTSRLLPSTTSRLLPSTMSRFVLVYYYYYYSFRIIHQYAIMNEILLDLITNIPACHINSDDNHVTHPVIIFGIYVSFQTQLLINYIIKSYQLCSLQRVDIINELSTANYNCYNQSITSKW